MAKKYCINCEHFSKDKKSQRCVANPAVTMTEGDAIYPPKEIITFADPLEKNADNKCNDFKKRKPEAPEEPNPINIDTGL